MITTRATTQARRSLMKPLALALNGSTQPLERWLARLDQQAQDGEEHPLLRMEHWSHHLAASGDRQRLAATAPLVTLLESDLPASIKARAIALTQTILDHTDPQTLTKWRYVGGVRESTWLRAIDVPEVLAFMRHHIPACRETGPDREDWSFAFVNTLLDDVTSDPSHHRHLNHERRARLWDTAVQAGLVRDDALVDTRYGIASSGLPGFVRDVQGTVPAYTALEALALNDRPDGMVDRWLARHGTTPAWISPASGASLVRLALSNPSPALLDHWLQQDPSLADAPMPLGLWGRRPELGEGGGLHLGGRYLAQAVLDRAVATSGAVEVWLTNPVPTLRDTLQVLACDVFPAAMLEHAALGRAWAHDDAWYRWSETFVLRQASDRWSPPSRSSTIRERSRL